MIYNVFLPEIANFAGDRHLIRYARSVFLFHSYVDYYVLCVTIFFVLGHAKRASAKCYSFGSCGKLFLHLHSVFCALPDI